MVTAKLKALLLKTSVTQSLHGQLSGFSPASAHKSNWKLAPSLCSQTLGADHMTAQILSLR